MLVAARRAGTGDDELLAGQRAAARIDPEAVLDRQVAALAAELPEMPRCGAQDRGETVRGGRHLDLRMEMEARGERRRGLVFAPIGGEQHVLAANVAAIAATCHDAAVEIAEPADIPVMARLDPAGTVGLMPRELDFDHPAAERAVRMDRRRIAVAQHESGMRGGGAQCLR